MASKSPKSMNLEQLKAYKQELKGQGYTLSTSKEMGKVENLIKTLEPQKYGKETVSSAYKSLSSGVKYTGGWTEKNLGAIESATGERPKLVAPTSAEQLPKYLSDYQDSVFNASSSPELRDSIVNQLEPDMAKPEPINRVEQYETMRQDMGVADLETSLTDLKAQLETEYATKRTRTQSVEGKPVAMGVIAGRVSEVERQETERIDAIGRQINVISDQLNTSYNVISTYMNFMGLDYQDSVAAYNSEFNKNLQIYNLVDSELDEQTANARANLQTYQNAILEGNISYSNLSSDQKSFINKLEIQSGLPIGFTSSLKPDEKVLYNGTRTSGGVKYLDVITQDSSGKPVTKTISLGASGTNEDGSDSSGVTKTKISDKDIGVALSIIKNDVVSENPTDTGDKYLSAKEINDAYNLIMEKYGNEETALTLLEEAMKRGKYEEWK
jgi:hypothetical protein